MRRLSATALLLLSAIGAALAQPSGPGTAPEGAIARAVLGNGLHVLVRDMPGSGELALAVAFRAGAAYEPPFQSGVAHLVEHMSFHGTESVGSLDWPAERKILAEISRRADGLSRESQKGQQADFLGLAQGRVRLGELAARARELTIPQAFSVAYRECGAQRHTASTGRDFVVFQALLPSAGLYCALALEARRMEGTALRGFVEERQAVLDELRERRADPPVALLEKTAAVVLASHPYGRSNWGTLPEASRLTPRQAEAFYRRFYRPANAVLAVVGDVEVHRALEAISRIFSGLVGGEPAPALPSLPAIGPARVEAQAPSPWLALTWQWPRRASPDVPALQALGAVLETRLRRTLVDSPEPTAVDVALQEFAAGGGAGGLTLFAIQARDPSVLSAIKREVERELKDLRRGPVPELELAAARRRILAKLWRVLQAPLPLARELAVLELQTGAAERLLELPAALSPLSAADLHRVAGDYLDPRHLSLTTLSPGGLSR